MPILLPPSISSVLEQYAGGESAFPLTAEDEGRFPQAPIPEPSWFSNCRLPGEAYAGLLLYAGFGLRSHAVSQDLTGREGSYWHGIYHRMEPDDWNAMYWFRRVGPHEIHPELCEQSRATGWNPGRNWDPQRFVDFVRGARESRDPAQTALAQRVQWIEWRLLFLWCAATKETGPRSSV